MSSNTCRSAHVLQVIDSDYDEDDEYQQNEIDEIFSISPTGEEYCDFDPSKEENGSEFDSEDEVIVPGGTGSGGICDDDDDEEDEDDEGGANDIKNQMVRFGIHDRGNKAVEAFMSESGRDAIDRLLSMKNKESYIKDLRQMNSCEECKQSLINSSIMCPKHGHYDHFSKALAASIGGATSKRKFGGK